MEKNLIENLYGHSESTYYRWKKENRPIISLVEKYISEKEIIEFLESGNIEKFNTLKKFNLFDKHINPILLLEMNRTSDDIPPLTVFSDLLYYYSYKIEYYHDYTFSESDYLEYLLEKTFIGIEDKIEYLHENKFMLSDILPYINDFHNDFKILIEKIKYMEDHFIVDIVEDFIAPALDMKYNNKCDINSYDDKFLSVIETINSQQKNYNSKNTHKISKKIILNSINLFLNNMKYDIL